MVRIQAKAPENRQVDSAHPVRTLCLSDDEFGVEAALLQVLITTGLQIQP